MSTANGGGQTRTYYIAADEVVWDFAPTNINQATGKPFDGDAVFFAMPNPMGLGHVYKKTIYREYTDATFKTLKPRTDAWAHLGMIRKWSDPGLTPATSYAPKTFER